MRTFFLQIPKMFIRFGFLHKNHLIAFLWTNRMQYRKSGAKSIKQLKVFPQFLKTLWWKKVVLRKRMLENCSECSFHNRLEKFLRNVWILLDQTRTPQLQIGNPVEISFVKNWRSFRSIYKKKMKILNISQIRPFFAQYPERIFWSNQFSPIVSLETWNAVWQLFWEFLK